MFTSDKLVLVELYRGGASHLKKLLEAAIGGESSDGKVPAPDELAAMGKPIVGYVCEPKAWYLAHWQQGCRQQGDIYKRLTDNKRWDALRETQAKRQAAAADKAPKEGKAGKEDRGVVPEEWDSNHARTVWYAPEGSVEAFRAWLKAVLATRGLRKMVDPAHAKSNFSKAAGPMTYRYFSLFVSGPNNAELQLKTVDDLKKLDASNAITSDFIRSEAAAEDYAKVLAKLHVSLPADQTARKGKKAAETQELLSKYYDKASERLVARHEAFLIEKFGYPTPTKKEDKPAAKAAKKKEPGAKAGGAKAAAKKKPKADPA